MEDVRWGMEDENQPPSYNFHFTFYILENN